jgi:hypothetical protein
VLLTTRQIWFLAHLGLGVLFVHASAGGFATLAAAAPTPMRARVRALSAVGMAVTSWATVVIGTFLVYAWYRATPPAGAALTSYPKAYLLAHPALASWHNYGIEWKEHIGWLVPFLATAVAFVVVRHRELVASDRRVRRILFGLFLLAFAGAVVAAGLGAVLNKVAPNQFLQG